MEFPKRQPNRLQDYDYSQNGDNTVIDAGSVVIKDIPANVVAAGNPCHVLRPITEEDTKYWEQQVK